MSSNTPTYPPTNDIGYAAWLKYFASKLSAYAERYHLTKDEVADVQRIAAEFNDWLAYRINRTSQAVWQRQNPANSIYSLGPEQLPPDNLFLLDRISVLVQRIQHHPSYSLADGYALGLAAAPQLHGYNRLPLPKLRVIAPTHPGQPPVLTWITRRDTIIEVEVCRDGIIWQPLKPTHPKQYTDSHPQPEQPTEWQYRARYRSCDWPPSRWGRPVAIRVGSTQAGWLVASPN